MSVRLDISVNFRFAVYPPPLRYGAASDLRFENRIAKQQDETLIKHRRETKTFVV
jgi:hypothetical protein